MTGESGRSEQPRWIIEPPGPQEFKFQIASGDEVDMTPEIRRAFEDLVEALSTGEVEGYTDACIGYIRGCTNNTFNCEPRQRCASEGQAPCFINYFCKIAT